jgi:hypothetical protein
MWNRGFIPLPVLALTVVALLCQGSAAMAATVGEPTLELAPSKWRVLVGRGVRLTWTATNVDYCVASGGWCCFPD